MDAPQISRRQLFRSGLIAVAGMTFVPAGCSAGRTPGASSPRPRPTAPPTSYAVVTDPAGSGLPWPEADAIVRQTRVPVFPALSFDITDSPFGGVGDGTVDNTDAFKRAIEECSAAAAGS